MQLKLVAVIYIYIYIYDFGGSLAYQHVHRAVGMLRVDVSEAQIHLLYPLGHHQLVFGYMTGQQSVIGSGIIKFMLVGCLYF